MKRNNPVYFAVISIALMLIYSNAIAQNDDSTLYKKLRVSRVESWVHVLAFENSNDTCLIEVKEIDSNGLMTYVKHDFHCYGYDEIAETRLKYNESGWPVNIVNHSNDRVTSISKMEYNEHGQVVKEETTYYEPEFVLLILVHQYFGKPQKPDSMITTEIKNGDTTLYRTTYLYNQKSGKQARIDVRDISNGKNISGQVFRYDEKNRLVHDEYVMYQVYDNDEITNITYNEKNQIVKTKSDINNTAAEFFYQKNGLMFKTLYYNKFEAMDREVWYKYTFR
ncbi:MAG: hypothetical protein GC181_07635 [Bacteroidetes bacterium]|nr:hypothetical protein [Bacteroidota bacterium]